MTLTHQIPRTRLLIMTPGQTTTTEAFRQLRGLNNALASRHLTVEVVEWIEVTVNDENM